MHWVDVEFVEEDWDSKAKIKMLNARDALYNEMNNNEIENIIKQK